MTDMSEGAAPLQGRADAARGVTSEVHCHGQSRDVCRVHLDVHAERGDASPESLWTDAKIVDAREQLALEAAQVRARVANVDGPQYRPLREERRGLERAADADADDDRRAGVGAGPIDGLDDDVGDP